MMPPRRTIRNGEIAMPRNLVLFALLLLMASVPSAQGVTTFTTIDPPGSTFSAAQGINTAGQIVGVFQDVRQVSHGFLLSDGVYTTIDPPGATHTEAFGINDSGQVSGLYSDTAENTHGFLLSDGVFTTLDFPKAGATYALGINNNGDIVGWAGMPGGINQGFVWKNGKYTALVAPKGVNGTWTTGINDSRDIVGYYSDSASAKVGFVLRHGRYRDIIYPKAWNTLVWGVDNNRRVVGAANVGNFLQGFAFKSGWGFSRIGVPGGGRTQVMGINSVGQKVGVYQTFNGSYGFLKTP
jgi:probable HAF family extracellular repeat protein